MEGSMAGLQVMPPIMAAPETQTLSGLNALLLNLYDEPHDTRAGWWNCLEHLRLRFRADQAAFIVRRRISGVPSELIVCGDEPCPETQKLFFDRLSALDPFSNLPPERVCTVQDILSDDEWMSSEFYRKYLSAQKLVQVMGADITLSSDHVLAFRICRAADRDDFTARDREEFQFLLPHLRRIADARIRHSTQEASECIFTELLDCMDLGVVVLDQEGDILNTNRAADRILDRRDGVSISHGVLRATHGQDNQALQKLVRQALQVASDGGGLVGTMGLHRADSEHLLGLAVRSLARQGAVTGIRQATAAVLLGGSRGQEWLSEAAVKSIFSLTNAETRLAMALVRGATIDEVALELGVSRNTIRTHLNGLFVKTGTNRQSGVIRALLGSIASIC
jgi:DNA-binding CsgD family transcriptional regulator/PAS domain-containing protein